MDTLTLKSLVDFAVDAAYHAGRITLGYFQAGVAHEKKADASPVTIADRSAEKYLREHIARWYPDDALLGEEFGEQSGSSGRRWIIDPIDGTKSFICGVPLYSCLIALTENDEPVLGVAHFPALGEMLYAGRGLGAYVNGRRARVSEVDDLSEAVLLFSEVGGYDEHKQAAFEALVERTYIRRTWGDAYGYLLVATGRAEIMLDPWMSVWDCGPLGVIMEEAGGTFTDWNGTRTIYGGESIATNGKLFDQVISLTRK